MAYEYEGKLKNRLLDLEFDTWEETAQFEREYRELEEVYRKAKAFDEIKEFIIEKLKEEEEEKPRTLLSDYDYGLYQAYDNVDDIIQEYLERD
ncbi:hypothetical protein ASS95_07165 [Staphylococcus equorum]|uniref:hypothetical protein n=1 Tax=Staphylococcus equorum TaxID=246432 RepID=UPI0008538404|nr:hypothetical protein [Staphylococcus equorum]OEK54309.1 hypothetical protein ASS95_07165 [Staphylococcus equorum]